MFTPQHLPQHHRSTGFNHLLPYLLFLLSPGIFPILLAFTQLEEPPSPSATFALIVDGEKTQHTYNREFDLVHKAKSWITHLRSDGKQLDMDETCAAITANTSTNDPSRDMCNLAVLTRAMTLELANVRWKDTWTDIGHFESICTKQIRPKPFVSGDGLHCKFCTLCC